jgi:hypothetical protein
LPPAAANAANPAKREKIAITNRDMANAKSSGGGLWPGGVFTREVYNKKGALLALRYAVIDLGFYSQNVASIPT